MKLKNYFPTTTPFKDLIKNSPISENQTRIVLEDVFKIKPTDHFENIIFSKLNTYKFNKITNKIKSGYPLQYAVGFTYFVDSKIFVNKNVLIPRPESEMIVELARQYLADRISESLKIIDVGTGSGCIAIAIAHYCQSSLFVIPAKAEICENANRFRVKPGMTRKMNTEIFATDISQSSLKIAQKNARENKSSITFLKSDLLDNKNLPQRFDLIIANLPYVDANAKIDSLKFEPESAIYYKDEGFGLIKELIAQLPSRLTKEGLAIFEIGYNHTDKIKKISIEFNQFKFSIQKDLGDFPRYLLVRFKKDRPLV